MNKVDRFIHNETSKVSSTPKLQASPFSSDGTSFPSLSDAVKQRSTKREMRNRHLRAPSFSSEQLFHTPITTTPTASCSTLDSSARSVDGLETVIKKLELSSPSPEGHGSVAQKSDLPPSDGPETMTQKSDLPPSDGHDTKLPKLDYLLRPEDGPETVTTKQEWSPSNDRPDSSTPPETVMQIPESSSPSDAREATTQVPDLASHSTRLQTMRTDKEWSPSHDGLPTFTQAQTDFINAHRRILPDDVFEHYNFKKRLPVFKQLCLGHKTSSN